MFYIALSVIVLMVGIASSLVIERFIAREEKMVSASKQRAFVASAAEAITTMGDALERLVVPEIVYKRSRSF
jgi:hypothetical protein